MIDIDFGDRPKNLPNIGYAYDYLNASGLDDIIVHLIAFDSWNHVSFCGQKVEEIETLARGQVCDTCAQLLGLRSANDFEQTMETSDA